MESRDEQIEKLKTLMNDLTKIKSDEKDKIQEIRTAIANIKRTMIINDINDI
jgi:hypothetical protein